MSRLNNKQGKIFFIKNELLQLQRMIDSKCGSCVIQEGGKDFLDVNVRRIHGALMEIRDAVGKVLDGLDVMQLQGRYDATSKDIKDEFGYYLNKIEDMLNRVKMSL